MNFNQIRFVCAIVEHGLSMTRAADALGVPQPVISRQIQLLEREIGVTIFIRNRKRILGLSKPGEAIERMARRILEDAQNIRDIGAEHSSPNEGELSIATTHTYARHILPAVIKKYSKQLPNVRVSLYEGSPNEIGDWLSTGIADLSISTKPNTRHDNLAYLTFEALPRVVLVPKAHPLLKPRNITLNDLAQYPIVTFHPSLPGGESIYRVFSINGLTPRLIVRATNADVIRAYVREGLGIGIISRLPMSLLKDSALRMIDVSHLFPPNQIYIGLRKRHHIRPYVYDFIRLFSPNIAISAVEKICSGSA